MNKFNLLLLATILAPLPAHATLSWNFTTGASVNYGSQGTFASSPGGNSVTVSAFSTTCDTTSSSFTCGADSNTTERFETATLGSWSGGIGVQSAEDGTFGTSPHHAFDNDGGANTTADEGPGGDVDAAIFAFTQSVNLASLSIGWDGGTPGYDADISVLAYTGAGNPVTSITGKTYTQLLSSGWTLIGNYSELDHPSNPTVGINAGNVSSSYWLVSAYTTCANAKSSNGYTCVADSNTSLDFGDDFFKISGLATRDGTTPPSSVVPEPSSLLLLSVGLLGWYRTRNPKTAGTAINA